jgi:hypothetical protein
MDTPIDELKQEISRITSADLDRYASEYEMKQGLSGYINELILKDFERLVQLLYRIDVSEAKLKNLLQEKKDTDAGDLIADMIIERQKQKIKSRREHGGGGKALPDEWKW